jgi:hypothetical protein
MANKPYKVILSGTIRAGFDRDAVLKNLARLFNRSPALIDKLLSGEPKVIRRGLDFATAEKYREALRQAGVISNIEPDEQPSSEAHEPTPRAQHRPQQAVAHELVCPRCGYEPTSDEDVLVIRGDCPRCGLLVKREARSLISDDSESIPKADASEVYGEREPATWKRRILASMHTLTIFLTAYLFFFFIFVLLVLPPDQIFRTVAREFLSALFSAFPMASISFTVFVVSFILPLVTGGRSWGQQLTNIGVLYAGEARMGGLQLALALRAGAILMVSFMPGLVAVRIGHWLGLPVGPWATNTVMFVAGAIGWISSWIFELSRKDRRGLLDLAGDTIQVEEESLAPDAVKRAVLPLVGIVALWLVFIIILPRMFR